MTSINDVKKLIRKHGYEVRLTFDDSGNTIVTFPERNETPECEAFSNTYTFHDDGVEITSNGLPATYIKTPKYSQRMVVFASIANICATINYNLDLVVYEIDGKEVTEEKFSELMAPFTLNKKEIEKENELRMLSQQISIEEESVLLDMAKDLEIIRGFKVVRNVYIGDAK